MPPAEFIDIFSSLVGTVATVIGVLVASVAVFRLTKGGGRIQIGNTKIHFPKAFSEEVALDREAISPANDDSANQDRQYLLLREYHAQGLAQSRISFWFSLVFAALGFIVIITAIFSVDRTTGLLGQSKTLISLIAGTVIDAVSALFFVQSNKARQLMVDFFDRLRSDKKLDESLRLLQSIQDPLLRGRLQALIALHFADIKLTDAFLTTALGVAPSSRTQNGGQNTEVASGEASSASHV